MTNGAAWGVLVLRIVLGIVLVMHGYLAVTTYSPRGVAGLVTRIGYPAWTALPLAWYLIAVHLVGGALIVIGLWTRLAAVLNIPVMLSAVALLHWSQGFFMRATVTDGRTSVLGYEFSLLVLGATVAIALIGPGPFSLDGRRPGRRR
jgi:putative oxidoreductase